LKKRRDRKAQKSQDASHGSNSGSGSGASNKSVECTPGKSDPKKPKDIKKKNSSELFARTSG